MISLIEAVLGSKVGRVIAEILFALIVIVAVVLHYEHKGAAEELGKLKTSSAKLISQAEQHNALDYDKYQADVSANQEKTNAALKSVATLQSQLADSVRGFDAYRRAHPAVAGAAGAGTAAGSGECGSDDCGTVASRLAVRGNELAGSLGSLGADLQSCQRDRDSLTGQPK